MKPRNSGGTHVTWQGTNGEEIGFFRLPTPFSNYHAEPRGGLLIITAQVDHSDPEILETDDLAHNFAQLSAAIGDRHVFWKNEDNAGTREQIKKKLGKSPRYIG